jgi:acyl-CoA hydrolase
MTRTVALDALDLRKVVRAGDLVCWGQAGAEPVALTRRLMAQRAEIGRFSAFIGISLTDTPDPAYADLVSFRSFCGTGSNRKLAAAGMLDIMPVHYSALPALLQASVDVLLLQVAEHPDGGRYSLSMACDYVAALVRHARVVVAEVNAQAPFTDAEVSADDLDMLVRTDRPLAEMIPPASSETDRGWCHAAIRPRHDPGMRRRHPVRPPRSRPAHRRDVRRRHGADRARRDHQCA